MTALGPGRELLRPLPAWLGKADLVRVPLDPVDAQDRLPPFGHHIDRLGLPARVELERPRLSPAAQRIAVLVAGDREPGPGDLLVGQFPPLTLPQDHRPGPLESLQVGLGRSRSLPDLEDGAAAGLGAEGGGPLLAGGAKQTR